MSKNDHILTANQARTRLGSRRTSSKAAEIVQRLPLHRSLSESQTMLVQLTPFWQLWLTQAADQNALSSACRQSTRLEAWQFITTPSANSPASGKLIISCDNATNATQLKQKQQSLVDYLNKSLAKHDPKLPLISKLVIRLRYDEPQMSLHVHKSVSSPTLKPVAETSIRAIEICQKTVSNEELAQSLKQLADTLRSLT